MEEQLEAIPPTEPNEQGDWDEEEEEYEEEDDEDITAEAQEIARRLGEQLWADISMANAERNAASASSTSFLPLASAAPGPGDSSHGIITSSVPLPRGNFPRKEETIVATMKAILTLVENDALAKETLGTTAMPDGTNVLYVLQQCVSHGSIARGVSGPLSQIMVTLARSEKLFGNLKNSDASTIQLDKGKRKREESDEGHHLHSHAYKRPYVSDDGLQTQVSEAVRVISQALGSSPPQSIDPALVSSIRLQLHQIFLFAVTSSAAGGVNMHALQEISGLIQVIGVLSGIQIGHSADTMPRPSPRNPYPWHPGQPPPMQTNIGTAVYPCLVTGCHKVFSRLYSLRAHQRSHASHRPFRCSLCPASFARNHDLKRHFRLHDKKAWRCEGCAKVFSRRDAIKRHKNGLKNKGPRSEICLAAEVTEVQLDEEDGEDVVREERRAKLWNGIAVNEANSASMAQVQALHRPSTTVDEGEINPIIIGGIQASVLGLHGLLQAFVGNALGSPLDRATVTPSEPSAGQATLASVIARAQSHNAPGPNFVSPQPTAQGSSGHVPDHPSNTELPLTEENAMQGLSFGESPENQSPLPSLSMYGLSDEQTHLLEIAIASAASAAQAQAEAEAALEEEEEGNYEEEEDYDEAEMDDDKV